MLSARLRQAQRTAQRKAATTHQVTARDLAKILTQPCIYCGAKADEVEHVIPLSRGGRHAIGNLAASCARCNASKRNRLVIEWKRWLGGRRRAAA
jgi:5-methylcytosine-specific restriction endonuclease McrA